VWHDVHVNREIVDQVCAAALVLLTLAVAERPSKRLALLLGVVSGAAMLGNTRLVLVPARVRALPRVAPAARAIATVASVLPESTIIHWFANRTLSRQAWMLAASFFVMIMTDSFMERIGFA